jgi:hypothetical protein
LNGIELKKSKRKKKEPYTIGEPWSMYEEDEEEEGKEGLVLERETQ